jgi:hypothetical protein
MLMRVRLDLPSESARRRLDRSAILNGDFPFAHESGQDVKLEGTFVRFADDLS